MSEANTNIWSMRNNKVLIVAVAVIILIVIFILQTQIA